MSTTRRLISGSAASWMQIGITIVSQLALVPIYLSYWNVKVYGVWIAIQALAGLISTVDKGHHYYLYFEFLKKSPDDKSTLSRMLSSGIILGLISGILQIVFVLIFIITGKIGHLLNDKFPLEPSLLSDAANALVFQCISWLLTGSVSGLFGRILAVYGYYPRIAWWNVLVSILTSIVPAIAVVFGADLVDVGIITAVATVLINIPYNIDMLRLIRREKITFGNYSLKEGFQNYLKSMAVTGKDLLEVIRQQGVRVLLAPLLGTVSLTAFATMRTGANMFLQGLNTITNPLLPELMRFLNKRDQERSDTAFGTIWIVLIAVLSPGVILVQALIKPIFLIWTRGHVHFDEPLFGILSLNVLIYGLGQPGIAVVIGNNLLRSQLIISIVSGVILLGSIFLLVPQFGLLGAGLSLFLAETASTVGYQIVARNWLHSNNMVWPKKQYLLATLSVIIATLGMAIIIAFPKWLYLGLVISISISIVNLLRYWHTLPKVATENALRLVGNIPGLNKFVK